jgi:aerobic carbon-monoxide dehydrogenase small subunit
MTQMTLNGHPLSVDAPPMTRLLDVLREHLRLTGTKEGCGEGECGACTVLIDGVPVNSCLIPVVQAEGASITTVEGLADDERLDPIQTAFITHGAAQCGICTPGFVVTARALLNDNPQPSRREVREALAGNLCRCTGYQKIIDAVVLALGTD